MSQAIKLNRLYNINNKSNEYYYNNLQRARDYYKLNKEKYKDQMFYNSKRIKLLKKVLNNCSIDITKEQFQQRRKLHFEVLRFWDRVLCPPITQEKRDRYYRTVPQKFVPVPFQNISVNAKGYFVLSW